MKKPIDCLTDEEIELRFDETTAELDAQRRVQMKAKWGSGTGHRPAHISGRQETPHRGAMEEVGRLLKESDGKIVLDAHLPSGNGAAIPKRSFVTPLFDRFLSIAAVLNAFSPEDRAKQQTIDSARKAYGEFFAASLVQFHENHLVGEADELVRVVGEKVLPKGTTMMADRLSLCTDIEYAAWFAENLCKHWDHDYVKKIGEALFDCSFEKNETRSRKKVERNPKNFKDRMRAEANRFTPKERKKPKADWRSENPVLAAHFEECFRVLSDLFFASPRGQQKPFDPSSRLVCHMMELGGEEIREGLLEPGVKFDETGGGTPSAGRASLNDWVEAEKKKFRSIGVTPAGVKKGYKNIIDRPHQGGRAKA